KLDLSPLPIRISTVNDGTRVKKKVGQEHEIGELQRCVSDEKTKTALENRIPIVIEDAAIIMGHTHDVTLFQ
ncbi:hypothetical protein F443_04907, partial [Phytophthora nicotianae P1569]